MTDGGVTDGGVTDGVFVACQDLPLPAQPADLPAFQADVLRRLVSLIGTPPFDRPCALDAVVGEAIDDGDWWRYKVRYGHDSDDVVWAWLLVPKGLREPAPAVLCLAGSFMTPNWGKDAPAGLAGPLVAGDPEAYGADLARLGYVTLCPDYPCCGERTTPGHRSHDTTRLDRRFPDWTRVGLSTFDVRRAVDFLASRDEVDADRIAAWGWSQGGQMAILGAAVDDRIGVVVSVCGWGPLRGVGGERAVNWARSYNFPRLAPHLENGLPLPLDFDHVVACLAPRPLLDVRARQDDTFPNVHEATTALDELAQIWERAGAAERFAVVSAEGGHAHGHTAAQAGQGWLRRWLAGPPRAGNCVD